MAIVLPHRKLIVIPKPEPKHAEVLDNVFTNRVFTLPNGDELMALPHCEDSLRMLRNMDINVDGCDMFDWYYQPPKSEINPEYRVWWWQLETARFLVANPRSFCTSTPRTGKTLSTLMAVDYVLRDEGGRALIVAPLTVANGGEWERTIKEWFPHLTVQMVHKNRREELRTPAHVYLINPDGLRVVSNELTTMANQGKFSVIVFDELTEYANTGSQRWLAARQVSANIKYRWGLTGTPGKPEKIYGQVKLINELNVPKYFSRWRDMTEIKVSQFSWKPKAGHEEVVKQAMSPCIRFDKEQLMTIPIPQVRMEYVPLSEQQEAITTQLKEEFQCAIQDTTIDVTTASTLAQKLLQVAGGAVKTEDGYTRLDATPKLEKLKELLASTERKKVIFGSFIGINDMLVDYVRSLGYTCEKIDGSVTGQRRSQILRDFMDNPDPHVLICHPRTTAFGVELASADMIICYGTPMAGAFMYQQLFERLSSSRQTAKETFVIHLAAGKQDLVSFKALQSGVNIAKNIVDLFTRELL